MKCRLLATLVALALTPALVSCGTARGLITAARSIGGGAVHLGGGILQDMEATVEGISAANAYAEEKQEID